MFLQEWADTIFQYSQNLLAQNASALTFLEKSYTRLSIVLNQDGKIPIKKWVFTPTMWRNISKRLKPKLKETSVLWPFILQLKCKNIMYEWKIDIKVISTLALCLDVSFVMNKGRKEGNNLFNDTLNTFYLRLYGVTHMVKDRWDSERGNPLLPHGLLFSISSMGSFICIIPQTG